MDFYWVNPFPIWKEDVYFKGIEHSGLWPSPWVDPGLKPLFRTGSLLWLSAWQIVPFKGRAHYPNLYRNFSLYLKWHWYPGKMTSVRQINQYFWERTSPAWFWSNYNPNCGLCSWNTAIMLEMCFEKTSFLTLSFDLWPWPIKKQHIFVMTYYSGKSTMVKVNPHTKNQGCRSNVQTGEVWHTYTHTNTQMLPKVLSPLLRGR